MIRYMTALRCSCSHGYGVSVLKLKGFSARELTSILEIQIAPRYYVNGLLVRNHNDGALLVLWLHFLTLFCIWCAAGACLGQSLIRWTGDKSKEHTAPDFDLFSPKYFMEMSNSPIVLSMHCSADSKEKSEKY